MQVIEFSDNSFGEMLDALCRRSAFSPEVEAQVAEILQDVRDNGDDAIVRHAKTFDDVELTPSSFRVPREVVEAAVHDVSPGLREGLGAAHANILEFASRRLPKAWQFSPRDGVVLGERFSPFERIAAYIPGGSAPLVSTVLHTVTMAAAAGVPEIVVTSPPEPDGGMNPAILHAAHLAGATEVYRLGGVYAIGALAYGTPSVAKVDKIVGPGNAYVAAAKRQVYGEVALDLVAGPSEVLIIADATARASFVAADLLAQAEHGSGDEKAVLLSTCAALIHEVQGEIERQANKLQRSECLHKVFANGLFLVHVRDLDHAIEVANEIAPEHLEVMTKDPQTVVPRITAAGAIFVGEWTPEPVGDFVAGPSHVLPTGGSAKSFSGLTVEQFFRRTSTVQYDCVALKRESGAINAFSNAEGLDAHGRAVDVRFEEE